VHSTEVKAEVTFNFAEGARPNGPPPRTLIRYSAESVVGSDFSEGNLCHASKINFGPSGWGMLVSPTTTDSDDPNLDRRALLGLATGVAASAAAPSLVQAAPAAVQPSSIVMLDAVTLADVIRARKVFLRRGDDRVSRSH